MMAVEDEHEGGKGDKDWHLRQPAVWWPERRSWRRAPRKAGRPSAISGSRRLDARIAVGPAGNKDRRESMSEDRPPLPPFTLDSAIQKVRAAEDAWNSCDPERVSLAYSVRQSLAKPQRVPRRARRDRRLPDAEVGRGSSTTGSSRNCGRSPSIASPCASPMSTTTIRETGSVPTATRTGSSTRTV